MKRIAVIFEENIFDRKGSFNAKCARVRHLAELTGWQIDVFCIQLFQDAFVSSVLGRRTLDIPGEDLVPEKELRKRDSVTLNGVNLNLVWKNYSIPDHFLFYKLGLRPVCYPRFLRKRVDLLKGYDVVAAHSFVGGFIAREAQRKYGIPFYITWHGSDIHTIPFKHPQIKELTAELIRDAKMNCFVSRNLMEISDRIGTGEKTVLYNGCDGNFVRYPEGRRSELRKANGVQGKKVVTYAGNMLSVKNVESLPGIFHAVQARLDDRIEFWVVGDGRLRPKVEAELNADSALSCRFGGTCLRKGCRRYSIARMSSCSRAGMRVFRWSLSRRQGVGRTLSRQGSGACRKSWTEISRWHWTEKTSRHVWRKESWLALRGRVSLLI